MDQLPRSNVKNLPANQIVTNKFPVMSYPSGNAPEINLQNWKFAAYGLVENEVHWSMGELMKFPQISIESDFHCVTQWSRFDNQWKGIRFNSLISDLKPLSNAKYVMIYSYGGYSTNLDLDILLGDDVLLAHTHDGIPLSSDHGGPLRLVVPKRYAWKSAKWVKSFEFMPVDKPGFWESRGYHMRGDPWLEERYWPELQR